MMQNPQVNAAGGGFGPPGGPPPGGFGGPPGGFGGPPGGFGGPPGGFGGPPGGFGGPPGGPPPGGFGGPPGGPPPGGFGGPPPAYAPPPPAYGAPPGGFGGPPAGAPPPDLQKKVDLWFIVSIASIFCACGLLGIIPVVMANNAKDALKRGDFAKAEKDIGISKLLCIIGFVGVAASMFLYAIFFVIMLIAR